jgi:hypothetical protein
MSACIGFLKACARELKGPMDSFKGFQQESEDPFQFRRRSIQRPGGHKTLLG